MKNVVKCIVYLDILLVGAFMYQHIYFNMFQERPEIPVILQPPSSRLRHRYVLHQCVCDVSCIPRACSVL